jgi:thiol:disulfide interchange protein DsbD
MAAGMIGIFELQPPAWMEKIRGGAAQKSGTLIGSFLVGAVAALVASPCTGPFVVSMLTFAATMGSPGIGFLLLFVLGLGMGAVFFAAGSLNLLARPGPWMVWVRYAFGVILFGVALYFLSSNRLLPRVPLLGTDLGIYVLGFGLAVLTWWGLARHLVKKEGERVGIARRRGAGMAVALVLVTGIVAQLTSHAAPAAAASGGELAATASEGWIRLRDVDHLQAEVARAKKEGRPVIVDVWATWCNYCKEFDHVIESDPHLTAQIGKFVRLKIDESTAAPADNDPLRVAAGLPKTGQPCMAFFDQEGRIRKAAQVAGWFGSMDASTRELSRRVDFLLGTPRE